MSFFSDMVIIHAFMALPGSKLKSNLSHSIIIQLLMAAWFCLLMALTYSCWCSRFINISRRYIILCSLNDFCQGLSFSSYCSLDLISVIPLFKLNNLLLKQCLFGNKNVYEKVCEFTLTVRGAFIGSSFSV